MNSNETERLAKMEQKQDDLCKQVNDGFDRVAKSMGNLEAKIDSLDDTFVTRHEFNPVRSIVYGMVGAILLGVLGAIITFFVGA